MTRSHARRSLASLLAALALSVSACVATPLPDPPSARPSAMALSAPQPAQLLLVGTDGAIVGGASRLRVTDPSTADLGGRVEAAVSAPGAFSATLAGALADVLYLEAVEPAGDVFLAAVTLQAGVVASVDPGLDRDADGSPDAIDCAPDDPLLLARECPTGAACATDLDCAAGQVCVAGVCRASSCVPEICGNGLDDDCNGVIDDGC